MSGHWVRQTRHQPVNKGRFKYPVMSQQVQSALILYNPFVMMALFRYFQRRQEFCLAAVITGCLAISACGPLTFVVGLTPGGHKLAETAVRPSGRWFAPQVVIIDVSGVIRNASKYNLLDQQQNPVSALHEKLEKARNDRSVKAVILRLNSPGGTVAASDSMYRMVKKFKEESQKPVVALMTDLTASGAYYLACACDKIVAQPAGITGSIGVIVQTVSLKPALTRIGIHTEAITTGPNKTVGSPLTTLTAEHRTVLRSLVDDFYDRFLDVVRAARPMIPSEVFDQVTDGRVVTGRQSIELGLADLAGDLDDAFDLAKQLTQLDHANLVLYHRRTDYVGSPYTVPDSRAALTGTANIQINLAQINLPGTLAQPLVEFYYLWQPDLP